MKLIEFFSRPIEISSKNKDDKNNIKPDDLFWYILDHDKIYKDYFFPIARKLKTLKECGPEIVLELFMPMVKKGCREYYSYNKMNGKLGKLFPKDLREELCHRLHEHYRDDIKNNRYKLGM